MKKIFLLLAVCCASSFSYLATAQTAEEIVASYLENIGGEEQLNKIKNMVITGKSQAQGMEFPVTMYQTADGKQRMDLVFQGKEITQMAFDGEVGWGVNFMTGEAEKMEAEQSKMMKEQLTDFPDPFLNYKEKGYTVELVEETELEGTPVYKIKLTKKPIMVEGEELENFSFYYFDKDSYVTLAQEEIAKAGPMKGQSTMTYTSDYDEVAGVYMPFSITSKMNGTTMFSMAIEKIDVNTDIAEGLFAFPEANSEGGEK
ncbi:LolA-like protein [Phaeodactylibacter luteus]|uniref:Outer membrane lipoprotein-sorting protein n=1 Tax=Phaeodactylibacter luteus TaxID=1564516 RepID=A0A5C6RI37_9BACT|nr:outer membrane lipoprotein-sorting protein [Phaeodactylibacter luteus]TXB61619.1 outer membrane lipoprotein-sorting protein [Phaeodactylibacter luteus]